MNQAEVEAPAGESESRRVGPVASWATVLLLCVLYTVSMLDRNLMSLLVIEIKADLGLSEVEMGLLIGAGFSIFYVLGALPLGWAMDRYRRPVVLWLGITAWSIGTATCGLAWSFATFFAARSLVGAGEAVLAPGAQSILSELFGTRRLALPMSVYQTSTKLGAGIAFAIGGLMAASLPPGEEFSLGMLGSFKGWQLTFLAAGLPGLLLAFAVFLIPDTRPPPSIVRPPRPIVTMRASLSPTGASCCRTISASCRSCSSSSG